MTNRATHMAGGDATWLHLDRPRNRMIVNTILWTDRPVDWDAVLCRLEEHVVARFDRLRTRAVDPALTLGLIGGARWETVPMAVDAHVVRVRLAEPGDQAALAAYVADQAALPLPASLPLWQLHAIDGFGAGSALLLRTHHAIADGTAIMRLVEVLTGDDDDPDTPAGPAPVTMNVPARDAGIPRVFEAGTWTDAHALAKLAAGIPNRTGPLVAPLSGTKSVAWTATVPLAGLRRAGADRSATVNDAALAVVAGGLREHLAGRSDVDGDAVEAVVPVHLRAPGEAVTTDLGNRFGIVFVPLPIDEADPGARVGRTKAAMDRIKASREAHMVYDAFVMLGRTPKGQARRWIDAFSRRASLVVTNIRGPARPVRLGGAPVEGMVLLVPSTGPIGIGVSLCTYAGQARLGLISDDAVVADAAGLRDCLAGALADLAGDRPERPPVRDGPVTRGSISGQGGGDVGAEDAEDLDDTVA